MFEDMKKFIAKLQNNHIFRGIASFGNIFGAPVRYKYRDMDDMAVLRKDWETIGNDMRQALNIYRKEVGYAR